MEGEGLRNDPIKAPTHPSSSCVYLLCTFGPGFSVCKKKSFSAGGLPLEAEALWLSLAARSLLPSPTHACLYVGSLWCILLGGLPGAVSPELWVAQMGERATGICETQRPPCVLDRQTDRLADLSQFISFTKKLEKNKAKQLILSDQYSEHTEIIAFF